MMTTEERIRHYEAMADKRERECKRATDEAAALDQEFDDLLLGLEDADDNDPAAIEAREVIAKCAKTTDSPTQAEKQHDPVDEAVKKLVDNYWFPDTDILHPHYALLADCDLTQELNSLIGPTSRHKALEPYHVIQERYCAISLIMNERGQVPPKFRRQRVLPPRTQKANGDDTLMMRDRQVIDMHWLHSRGKRDALPDRDFAEMFVGDEFDIDLAAVLAGKSWKVAIKTEKVLNLIPHEQMQMAILRTKAIGDAWRNAENSMKGSVDRLLREQLISMPSLRPHVEDFKRLWLADKMVGKDGLAAIAQMHAWLSGKMPLATTTLSDKLRRMRRRTAAKASKA